MKSLFQYLIEQLGLIAKKETPMPIRSDSGLNLLVVSNCSSQRETINR